MGDLKLMSFDLADLKTFKPAVEKFRHEASSLDVLFINAAVMNPPANSVTVQLGIFQSYGKDVEELTSMIRDMILILERVAWDNISQCSFPNLCSSERLRCRYIKE